MRPTALSLPDKLERDYLMRHSPALPTLCLSVLCASLGWAQVAVLTYHNDNFRTGQNLNETALTPASVNVNNFGQQFAYPVDGQVYAQPLYVPNVAISGKGTHNVVFVATQNDSVYALDADSNAGANATPLWQAAFANPANGVTPVSSNDLGCGDISPQIGITGTPVIDPVGGTLYVVAKTKEVTTSATTYHQRLHALDITSGAEKFGGPFVIPPVSVPGNCAPNIGGRVVFSALHQGQRAGLVLSKGVLYIFWASHCDFNPYTGWVMAFNPATGKVLAVFDDAPTIGTVSYECRAGIWQGGAAPAVDTNGSLFFATGNGYFNANTTGGLDYGDSQMKLSLSKSGFTVGDYFTPADQATLDGNDTDLGSGGVLLLPNQPGANPHLLAQAGKEGTIYLINRDNMGKYNPSGDNQIVQELPNAIGGLWGMPAYFNGSVYFGGSYDSVKAFSLTNGLFGASPASQSPSAYGYPGPTPSISAHGHTNGIVWAIDSGAWGSGGPGVLHAYDATNLGNELYNSTQNATRDQLGPAIKFTVPTIANGRVYVGTGNSLAVFGLLPPGPNFTLTVSPASLAIVPGGSGSYQIAVGAPPGFSFQGTVSLSVGELPAGASAVFNPASITGQNTGALTITASSATPLGSYAITITGVSGGITQTASATLVVSTATSISIHFVGNGIALNPTDVAGVVPKPNWNNLTATSSATPVALVDENGNATPATVTWSGYNPWSMPIPNTPANFAMMQGYLDDGDGSTSTVSVSGLAATTNGYTVYVYADGDNPGATREANYTIAAPGAPNATLLLEDVSSVDFSGTFVQVTTANPAGNYIVFSIPGTSFTLTATPVSSTDPYPRAPVNGIQIVPQ